MAAVFISHASVDSALADGVERLLRAAVRVPADGIRCAVTPTGAHPRGTDTPTQLRADILGCEKFVLVATPAALRSQWVLMELGAAWAAERPMLVMLASGARTEDLPGPIRNINATSLATDQGHEDLVDFVKGIPGWTGVRVAKEWSNAQAEVRSLASAEARTVDGVSTFSVEVARVKRGRTYFHPWTLEVPDDWLARGLVAWGMVGRFTSGELAGALADEVATRLELEDEEVKVSVSARDLAPLVGRKVVERPTKQSYQLTDASVRVAVESLRKDVKSASKSAFGGAKLREIVE